MTNSNKNEKLRQIAELLEDIHKIFEKR